MGRILKDQCIADLHPEIRRLWSTRNKEPETQVFDWGLDPYEPPDHEKKADDHKVLAKAMEGLSDRVVLVLTGRFWFDKTFVELADDLDVSTERIRQLERVGRMIIRKKIREMQLREDIERFTFRRTYNEWRKRQRPNWTELQYRIWRVQQNPRRIKVSSP
jgi:DNA-directed RNA polymerase sigma subunit (sigma70/sigma32)